VTGCPNPIFIGGCPRSGTTALWNALTRHPNLGPAPDKRHDKELWFYVEFFRGRDPQYVPYRHHDLDKLFLAGAVRFINDFMTRHCSSVTGRYITAHPNNIFHAREIHKVIPGARFLLVVRHPQENVWSMLNAPFAVSAGWRTGAGAEPTRQEITHVVQAWKDSARIVLDALRGSYGDGVMVVRHEDMVARPISLMQQVMEFVGEPFLDASARALAGGIINSSFTPGDRVLSVRGDEERLAYYDRTRARLAERPDICSVVVELVGEEMGLLGYEDHARRAQQPPVTRRVETVSERRAAEAVEVRLVAPDGKPRDGFGPGEAVSLRIVVRASESVANLSVGFLVRNDHQRYFGTTTFDEYIRLPDLDAGERLEVGFQFDQVLPAGKYHVDVSVNSVSSRSYLDNIQHHLCAGAAQLDALASSRRPIHYLFNNPVHVRFAKI